MIEYKIADYTDWGILLPFYRKAFRANHPLQNEQFWKWQYGNESYGKAIIGVIDNKVVAHLGLVIEEEKQYVCSINLFVDPEYRSGDVFLKLFEIANEYGKQHIGVSVNNNAIPLLRLMKWYQYVNLERKLIVHPDFMKEQLLEISEPILFESELVKPKGYFWEQPTLKAVQFEDGSTAIIHEKTGGVRFVEMKNIKKATLQAFEMGFRWCDYITSFNNPILAKLELNKWKTESEVEIPWFLDPIEYGRKSNLTFLSKEPIDINFYVNRTHADLGRVGSIV